MKANLIRIGALAAVVAGPWLIIFDLILSELLIPGDTLSESAASTSWTIAFTLHLIGTLLIPVVLVGLYARQAEQSGTLGLVGFLAALVGSELLVGLDLATAFVVPNVAVGAPEFLDASAAGRMPPLAGVLGVSFLLSIGAFGVGWLVFGVATIRARVFPRAAATALTVAALLCIPGPPLGLLGLIAFYVTVPWLGLIVLRERRRTSRAESVGAEAQPRME